MREVYHSFPKVAFDTGIVERATELYVVPADVPALVRRYERDFPEHATR